MTLDEDIMNHIVEWCENSDDPIKIQEADLDVSKQIIHTCAKHFLDDIEKMNKLRVILDGFETEYESLHIKDIRKLFNRYIEEAKE